MPVVDVGAQGCHAFRWIPGHLWSATTLHIQCHIAVFSSSHSACQGQEIHINDDKIKITQIKQFLQSKILGKFCMGNPLFWKWRSQWNSIISFRDLIITSFYHVKGEGIDILERIPPSFLADCRAFSDTAHSTHTGLVVKKNNYNLYIIVIVKAITTTIQLYI